MLGIAAKTLRKHCKTEIAIGKTIANFRVADALFKMATDPNGGAVSVAAAKFFLKARAGWKESITTSAPIAPNRGPCGRGRQRNLKLIRASPNAWILAGSMRPGDRAAEAFRATLK